MYLETPEGSRNFYIHGALKHPYLAKLDILEVVTQPEELHVKEGGALLGSGVNGGCEHFGWRLLGFGTLALFIYGTRHILSVR